MRAIVLEFEKAVNRFSGELNLEQIAILDTMYNAIPNALKAKINPDIKATYLALSAQAQEIINQEEEKLAVERYLEAVFPDKVSMDLNFRNSI